MKSIEKRIYNFIDQDKSDRVLVFFYPNCSKEFQKLYHETCTSYRGKVIMDNFYKIPCISLINDK